MRVRSPARSTAGRYTLSLHDALPISARQSRLCPAMSTCGSTAASLRLRTVRIGHHGAVGGQCVARSEEHTSELQSQSNLVCRLLLEKKKFGCILIHPLAAKSLINDLI